MLSLVFLSEVGMIGGRCNCSRKGSAACWTCRRSLQELHKVRLLEAQGAARWAQRWGLVEGMMRHAGDPHAEVSGSVIHRLLRVGSPAHQRRLFRCPSARNNSQRTGGREE